MMNLSVLALAVSLSALVYPLIFSRSSSSMLTLPNDGGRNFVPPPLPTSSSSSPLEYYYGDDDEDVLFFDEAVFKNVQATHAGANSYITVSPEEGLSKEEESQFKVLPLLATVDRRPLIVRKQLMKDTKNYTQGGQLLGCAIASNTFVSNLNAHNAVKDSATCHVCFQFSNREDASNFLPTWYKSKYYDDSMSTKCISGTASGHVLKGSHKGWQKNVFPGHGYPWNVDCRLPDGYPELTCRSISAMQNEMESRDDIQKIYYKTSFEVKGQFSGRNQTSKFNVHSTWPWEALMSHDDDRSKIAKGISMSWNDTASDYVPENASELKLAHVEGPGYDMTMFNGETTLRSMRSNSTSERGGVHPRLVINLFNSIRNSPGTTHIVAVVDGQINRSLEYVKAMLATRISELYPLHWKTLGTKDQLQEMKLIPVRIVDNDTPTNDHMPPDTTLEEVLRLRKIKVHLFPFLAQSMVSEKAVCSGQYAFGFYIAARYAADYHVMMYLDGDTILQEQSKTVPEAMYDRSFGPDNSKICVGNSFHLIEQYISPENDIVERVLDCAHDLHLDDARWKSTVQECVWEGNRGHVVARSDSIHEFSVHFTGTLSDYLPSGVRSCHPRQKGSGYTLEKSELVQVHLRNRKKRQNCACFVDPRKTQ